MLRRDVLTGLLSLAAAPALGQTAGEPGLQLGTDHPFDPSQVVALARAKSMRAYTPRTRISEAWTSISYENYRSIWFDVRNAVWEGQSEIPLRLDVFAPGLYFPYPIQIAIVENGRSRPLKFNLNVFDTTDKFPDLPIDDSLGYSGLRLRAELEQPDIYQEFLTFQGASYFRAIGTNNIYGLSARGLAIDTGEPKGEEFPDFEAFWVETPARDGAPFVIHALLDSPSVAGAYRFTVVPGQPLVMNVEATLFPREEMKHVGIAPLTSMFQFDGTNRDRFSDFRPAVHDSNGLLIHNGAGETIWRPLANPKTLQISAFLDENPRGFGLMQRARKFNEFADLEALYHRRPGLWVEPLEDWGKGSVALLEIPTDSEIYDNIAAYWRPRETWKPGDERRMSYRLIWGDQSDYGDGIKVLRTRIGAAFEQRGIIVAIDFEDSDAVPEDLDKVTKLISSSTGEISSGVLQRNPETGGPRLAFKFHPGEAQLIEFRAQLRLDGVPLSEVWLYRWTP